VNAPLTREGGQGAAGTLPDRALVVGLGETGLSAARHLVRRGLRVTVVDSRPEPPGLARLRAELPEVAVHTGGWREALFRDPGCLVLSPGVPLDEPPVAAARARGVPLLGDLDLFMGSARAPVLAVTGSNGKSTVTALAGEMLSAAGRAVRVGGNIGTPMLDLLEGPAPAFYLLELSSFQLERAAPPACHAAAVLNFSADHLDRHAGLADYAAAKARIFQRSGLCIYHRDDPAVVAMLPAGRRAVGFGLGAPAGPGDYGRRMHDGGTWLCRGGAPLLRAAELQLAGEHNQLNVLAALALAEAAGADLAAAAAAARRFAGLPHRAQRVAERRGVVWIDDSKGTNVGATCAALAGLPGPVVLIAGGEGKGQDFAPLARAARGRLRAAVCIGRDGPRIAEALQGVAPVLQAGDMDAAVARAAALAQAGDQVLLSPACASFDMFRDYHERGEAFAAAVGRLPA